MILLLVAALAAMRWATLLTEDEFGPIRDLREWIEYRWPTETTVFYESEVVTLEDGSQTNRAGVPLVRAGDAWGALNPHPLGTLATCIRCMSVWTGLVAMVLVVLVPDVALVVFLPFAFSQAAITLKGAD